MAPRRKPLDESFAAIAATGNVETSNRDAAKPVERDNVTTSKRDNVKSKSHVSLYLTPKVQRTIKIIAAGRGVRPHAIYLEGVDLVLAKYGELDRSRGD